MTTNTKACELLRLYKATFALCSHPSSFPSFFWLILAKGGVDDIKSFTHSLFDATTTLPVSVGALVDVDFSIFFLSLSSSLLSSFFFMQCREWLIKSAKVFHCHHLPAILSPSLFNSSYSSLFPLFFFLHTPAYVHSDHTQISGRLFLFF